MQRKEIPSFLRNMICRTALTLLFSFAIARLAGAADAAALWSGKVQPLFDVQCVKCHGPIEQKSGLELDTPEAVLKGGDEGAVVVPGHPEKSRLYQYLAAGADPHMPPKKQLTEPQREMVREWIAAMDSKTAKTGKSSKDSKAPRKFDSVTSAIDSLLSWRIARRTA